jgi:hypothetical protein
MILEPRYFVEWWGDLKKDPLDCGVMSFCNMNGPAGANTYCEMIKNKGCTVRLFEGYDMYYRGSAAWPIK